MGLTPIANGLEVGELVRRPKALGERMFKRDFANRADGVADSATWAEMPGISPLARRTNVSISGN